MNWRQRCSSVSITGGATGDSGSTVSVFPHWWQNFASSSFCCWHCAQSFICPRVSQCRCLLGKEAPHRHTSSAAHFKLLPPTSLCYLPLLYKGIRLPCRQKN